MTLAPANPVAVGGLAAGQNAIVEGGRWVSKVMQRAGKPKTFRCSSHKSGKPSTSLSRDTPLGSFPARMSSTMSGARDVRLRIRLR